MKLFPRKMIVIDIALLLVGIAFITLSASQLHPILQKLLEAVGTGFIASVLISMLDHYLNRDPHQIHPMVIELNRSKIGLDVHNKKFTVMNIDIAGISLHTFMDEISKSRRFADRVIENPVEVRIAFVHPDAWILEQRKVEDKIGIDDLKSRQLESIRDSVRFYKLLHERYLKGLKDHRITKPMGRLYVWVINACPYITITRYDNEIYWGLYPSNEEGIRSPMFLTTRSDTIDLEQGTSEKNNTLYGRLLCHFDSLLSNHYQPPCPPDNLLVRCGLDGPWLNKELAAKLLTQEVLDQILR